MGDEATEGQVQSLLKRLDEIAKLGDNWDSYGAKRINPAVIKAAKWYIEMHCQNVEPAINVMPTATGEIQLEWRGYKADTTVRIAHDVVVVNRWFDDWPDDHEPMRMTTEVPFLGDDGELERVINQCLGAMPEGAKRRGAQCDHVAVLAWECMRVYVFGHNGTPPTVVASVCAKFDDASQALKLLGPMMQLATQIKEGGGICAD